ncbi:phosphotransferase [Hydrogenophaga taeniospiralis]|uniref:phosphotransferase enzyme family protein n=1 Tax=Hydrogenophaga taeniospiralis TaxID=65656 RepID=UPI001CFC3B80|nr:phosphotransferase [Hydrogenophaga taeniospiralis]MCB4364179.1 phosphotransferase [Hydrogenophaga taeniospiralis]
MTDLAQKAAAEWGLAHARLRFVAGRENQVYRVSDATGDYALRLKRPGYRKPVEIESELMWMAALDRAGILVPRPVPSRRGHLMEQVDGHLVDLLTWMPGQTLGALLTESTDADAQALFHNLGRCTALFHAASDAWAKPVGFARVTWDADGLLGEAPLWGRFWEHPALPAEDKALFEDFRARAAQALRLMASGLDHGLIHADLVRENVLISDGRIGMLDFDDGGWGYRVFDLATTLLKFLDAPNFSRLKDALLRGYLSVRSIDTGCLDLFLALRAVTYVGWIVPRLGEDGALDRSHRYIATARNTCSRYLMNSSDS